MIVRAWLALVPWLAACTADTFVAADAASDAPPGPACGQTRCAASESCCVGADGGAGIYTCSASCPTQQNVAALACTQASDCPNGVCCMRQSNGVTSSQCETQCGSNEVQLCNPSAQDTGCSTNNPCSTSNIHDWGLPQTFGTCGGLSIP